MNDKFKLTSIFNFAENSTKEDFSLPEIGVKLPETEEAQLVQHNLQILDQAERVLDEAA